MDEAFIHKSLHEYISERAKLIAEEEIDKAKKNTEERVRSMIPDIALTMFKRMDMHMKGYGPEQRLVIEIQLKEDG